jgi:hypothetical protein
MDIIKLRQFIVGLCVVSGLALLLCTASAFVAAIIFAEYGIETHLGLQFVAGVIYADILGKFKNPVTSK